MEKDCETRKILIFDIDPKDELEINTRFCHFGAGDKDAYIKYDIKLKH